MDSNTQVSKEAREWAALVQYQNVFETAQAFQRAIDQSALAEREATKSEIDRLEYALAYLASCTAATAENMLERKSTPKSELQRHKSICTKLLAALRGESLERRYGNIAGIGAEHRLERTIAAIRERKV